MGNEYILFSNAELNNLEKTFLVSQLSVLNSLKNLSQYKKARSSEFASKIKIKTLLSEAGNELHVLNKLLPRTEFKTPEEEKEEVIFPVKNQIEENKKDNLEDELERIKRRLELLK